MTTRGGTESWDFRDARAVFACEGVFPRRFVCGKTPRLPFMKSFISFLTRPLVLCAVLTLTAAPVTAADTEAAEATALRLVPQQEKEGYEFRSELWTNELAPDLGRAVRMQLFKGNEYAFCIAVPDKSGVAITAAVLDFDGKPGGELLPVKDGWGLVLFYKPKKTGSMPWPCVRRTRAKRRRRRARWSRAGSNPTYESEGASVMPSRSSASCCLSVAIFSRWFCSSAAARFSRASLCETCS
jgi:hypothetical protein